MPASTLKPDMNPGARTPRWPVLLVRTGLGLLFALLLSCVPTAHADDIPAPPPLAPGSNAVGSCLQANQVWLFVVDVDGAVLANQCVGTPASGEEALARGGMQLRFSSGRLICSLSGHPEQCPATFTGSYWNYHHGAAGTPYAYAKEGAATRHPRPGDIEAWCYNAAGEKSCTPELLRIITGGEQVLVPGIDASGYVDPAVTANESVPVPASTPWALIGTGATIAVGVLALLWWRRRTGPTDSQVGGR
ncbi:MAG: hypothetical protein Q4P15_08325 [Propionibacteriaceae bacterium]|nr:hypothetical protein [Propionibacteriaceae bacterium]